MPSVVKDIRVTPMIHGPKSNVDFGATVRGIDLNNLTEADFEIIHAALHKHNLLIFKGQLEMLRPRQQYELTRRFDPDENTGGFAHGVDLFLTSHNVDIFGLQNRPAIPAQPQVHILGQGEVTENHHSFAPGFKVKGIDHHYFHLRLHISTEEREAVRTRKGPDVRVQWDDGTGTEISTAPGATAMVAGSRTLERLTPKLREIAYSSKIEYAPHCFEWISTAHSTRLGHITETEGVEKPLHQLKPWTKGKICIYPMVHGQGAFKLFLKSNPDGDETVVSDLKEVRAFLHRLMRPVLEPTNIYAYRYEEQDVILWYNRALWHSITEFPESYGPRIMHQCSVAASDHPLGARELTV